MHAVSILSASLLLLVAAVAVAVSAESVESSNAVENSTQSTGRWRQKEYSPPIYSQPDTYFARKSDNYYPSDDTAADGPELSSGFEPSIEPRLKKVDDSTSSKKVPYFSPTIYEEYVPVDNAPRGPRPRYYVPEAANWNIWQEDHMDSSATSNVPDNSKGGQPADFGDFYFPSNWKGDPWMMQGQMPTGPMPPPMMMMMNQMQSKSKLGGLLSKLTHDPTILLIVAILPISMILAAVLPTLMNMMMNGGIPTITTTATGNKGRGLDTTDFLSPVMQTITTFGARSFDNPECMQKIFCQVTKGPSANGTESRSFQKALFSASRLIDSHWLEKFGVKTLFDSMADGNCEKIPCSTQGAAAKSGDKKRS